MNPATTQRRSSPPFSKIRTPQPPQEKKQTVIGKVFSVLSGRESEVSRREREIDAEKAEAEKQRAELRKVVEGLNALTTERDKAVARLKLADEQFAGLKADRESLLAQTRQRVWGLPLVQGRTVDVHYMRLGFIDLALADFPEARKPLAAAVEVAEEALATFRKKHDLGPELE